MDPGDHPPEAIFVRVEIFLLFHKELNFDVFLNIYESSCSQKMFSDDLPAKSAFFIL